MHRRLSFFTLHTPTLRRIDVNPFIYANQYYYMQILSHITEPAHTHIDTQTHTNKQTNSLTHIGGLCIWCRFRFFSLLLLLFFSSSFFLVVCHRRWIPCVRSFVGRSVRSCVHNDECWFMHSLRVFCVIVIIANSSSIRLMQKPHQHPSCKSRCAHRG